MRSVGMTVVPEFLRGAPCHPRFQWSRRPPLPSGATSPSSPASVNDLAIRVGTVNGSGSQSANLVLLRALYAMGIPCSGKNVFPSNIEGLPTWFHIRASAKGYVGHRLDPPVLVCMNEPTAADDVRAAPARGRSASTATTSTWTWPSSATTSGSSPCRSRSWSRRRIPPDNKDKGYRDKLRKVVNMVYVGVVAYACGIEMEAVEAGHPPRVPGPQGEGRRDQHPRRARPATPGPRRTCPADLPFRVERMDATTDKILIEGNKAAALGVTLRRDAAC